MTTLPLCACGCGETVNIVTRTMFTNGRWYIKGQHYTYRWGHARQAHLPRVCFDPLDVGPTTKGLARQLGVSRRQVYRWRERGVTLQQADKLAARLGRHPGELWAEWWEMA